MNILELKTKTKIEDIGIFGRKAIDLNPKEKDKLIEFLYDEMESYKDKYLKSMLTPRIC
jgi:hypothetical protein